ncbi:MAG: phosphotransferase family protein, partial [Ktedonobacterales bacterium]
YALMPRLPGQQFADEAQFATLSMDDRIEIAAAMGETLANLHALTWPFAGRYNAATDAVDAVDVAPDEYGEWVIGLIEGRLAEALALSAHTTQADVEWARALIAAGREALATPCQPCVVMGDYHPGNVTALRDDGRWRVSGVFDLMTLEFGDGEADLARLGRMYAYEEPRLAQAYIGAYLARRPPRPGFTRRFPIYLRYDCCIIWAFCLRNNDIWWPADMTLRGWVAETLELLRAAHALPDDD